MCLVSESLFEAKGVYFILLFSHIVFLTALCVFYRDVQNVVTYILLIWSNIKCIYVCNQTKVHQNEIKQNHIPVHAINKPQVLKHSTVGTYVMEFQPCIISRHILL